VLISYLLGNCTFSRTGERRMLSGSLLGKVVGHVIGFVLDLVLKSGLAVI
jgi:hypothetical protein